MPKDPQSVVTDYTYTQNRELSWLRFNRRVLEEGADETVPALERLKFIAIFASNLDEFFMVRVGSLVDMAAVSPEEVDSKSGMRPREQLKAVYEAVPGLIEIKGQLYNRVSGLLAQEGIVDLTYDQLTQEERAQVKDYFHSVVLPILSPQIVGQRHPTPHLDNKALYITALLRSKSGKTSLGFIPLPTSLPPLFLLPGTRGRFLRLETILRQWAPTLFGKYKVEETCVISATRNADLTFDTEKFEDSEDDFRLLMTKLLKRRANQSIVRLELGQRPSQEMLALLERVIQVETHQIYYCLLYTSRSRRCAPGENSGVRPQPAGESPPALPVLLPRRRLSLRHGLPAGGPVPAVCKARGLRGGLGGVPPGAPVEDARPPGGLLRRPAVGLDQPPDPGGGPGPSGGGRSVGGGQPGRRRGAAGPGPEGTQTLPAGSPLWGAGLPVGDPLFPGDHRPEGLVPGQLPDLLGQGAQPRAHAHPCLLYTSRCV